MMELSHIHHHLQQVCVARSFSDPSDSSLDLASDPIDDSCDTIIDSIAEIIVIVDRPDDYIVREFTVDDHLVSTHILHIIVHSLIARCPTDRIRTVDIGSTTGDCCSDEIRTPVKIGTNTRISLRRELHCHTSIYRRTHRSSNILYLTTLIDSTHTRLQESWINWDIGMEERSTRRHRRLQ
jgi:hypothetical protein